VNPPAPGPWLRRVLLVGAAYLVAGLLFGALAAGAASHQMRVAWRLAAWMVSAAAFAAQIGYEHFQLRIRPRATAVHAALAVAMGACAVAVAANIHALRTGAGNHTLLALALVIWPVATAGPAFLAAWAVAVGLERWRPPHHD
jgi:hypothetical protein